jgi:LCP family protein required for cell wall assembly
MKRVEPGGLGAARPRSSRWVRRRARRRRTYRALTTAASTLVLLASGYGWHLLRDFSDHLTTSDALGAPAAADGAAVWGGGALIAPENLLIMGLDSRRDQNGDPLPSAVLDQLHAGDSEDGGYNTNVLMLVHLPGTAGQPVGISVPRDDYVQLADRPGGQSHAKIKEAYGLAKAAAEQAMRDAGMQDRRQLELGGREAGRKAAVDAVQDFLGVHVDHFVEVTLVGFYDLARALGRVTVCLQGPTQDRYSGARFVGGQQQLDAAQALAFVRQRRDYVHPELNFTDLDRARRQQAFLSSVAYQLSGTGVLTSPSRLHALVEVADRDVVVDRGLDVLDLAQRVSQVLKDGLSFITLPVKSFSTVHGADVNLVDPAEIKRVVSAALGRDQSVDDAQPRAIPPAVLDITNATARTGLAARVATALGTHGLRRGSLRTAHLAAARTSLGYGPGSARSADVLARLLGLADLTPRPDDRLPPGHVRLVLGADFTMPPAVAASPVDGSTDAGPADGTASATRGTGGVPTSSLRTDGIPCVK